MAPTLAHAHHPLLTKQQGIFWDSSDVYPSLGSRVGNLLHFVPFLVYFGLAIYAATSSVVVLAAEAEVPWVWWATLFPLAIASPPTLTGMSLPRRAQKAFGSSVATLRRYSAPPSMPKA
jgi:hypothetical protein